MESERVIALDQPEYIPLVGLPVLFSDGKKGVSVRFRFSEEERRAIADGADLVITELVAGGFTPIHTCLSMPNQNPFS